MKLYEKTNQTSEEFGGNAKERIHFKGEEFGRNTQNSFNYKGEEFNNYSKERTNHMRLEFDSHSQNEAFARVTVAAFMTQLNPTVEEVADVKTAVSEAVTNAIIHGYEGKVEKISIECALYGRELEVTVEDKGVGMEDVKAAMEPLYTSKPELERSGMGFAFMEAFMDELQVESKPGEGTKVHMKKKIGVVREE